jgi:coenzyme F420-reducing hydrogenase delta subunit/ferredoxin
MNENCVATVKIDQDLCSRCLVCFSLCPFNAIVREPEEGKVRIDIERCQVCGICTSACPVSAIDMTYYDYQGMLDQIRSARKERKADTLVMMCRGNSPNKGEIERILMEQGQKGHDFVMMRVPCAGRIPTPFIFNALKSGFRNIVSIQCHDDFCRMKEGTKIEARRMLLGKAVIKQLGYPEDTLKVVKYSRKAIWDSKECVGCGKCVFICPYEAIRSEPFSSPTIITEKCMGCGACQMVCPHNAIQVNGYRYEDILATCAAAVKGMKERSRKPSVLVFSCQWSEYSALDDPQKMLKGKNALMLEVPCFKGMDPLHVVNAFHQGFDGVMAVVCSAKDCKLQNGRDAAERQLEVLLGYLEGQGLSDRFEIHELSPRCEGEFTRKFETFHERISLLPPCPQAETKGVGK